MYRGLLELLAPSRCAGCAARASEDGEVFCDACVPLLDPYDNEDEPCFRAVYRYGGPVADAIQRLKYGARSEIGAQFGPLLADRAACWLGHIDVIACVPVSARRLRERGYNQSALLAASLSRMLGVPFDARLLHRQREGAHQVGNKRAARLAQVQGAMGCRVTDHERVLVIDDVRTTGATLREAQRALHAAGVRSVFQLVLAVADAPATSPSSAPRHPWPISSRAPTSDDGGPILEP